VLVRKQQAVEVRLDLNLLVRSLQPVCSEFFQVVHNTTEGSDAR